MVRGGLSSCCFGNLPRVRTRDSLTRVLIFSELAFSQYNISTLARRVLTLRTGEMPRRHGALDRPPNAFRSKSMKFQPLHDRVVIRRVRAEDLGRHHHP